MKSAHYYLLLLLPLFASCEADNSTSTALPQAQREEKIITDYLEANNLDATRTENGIYYERLQEGAGTEVEVGDTIGVHYQGWVLYGSLFDDSRISNNPLYYIAGLGLGNVIEQEEDGSLTPREGAQVQPGFQLIATEMQQGDVYRAYFPSALMYGSSNLPPGIPANAILVFEIEVIDVRL